MITIIRIFVFSIITIFSQTIYANDITWVGGTSTSWTTASNFSPAVVPGTSDTVTIVSGSTYDPELQGNTEIGKMYMQSGTLDLNGYELQVNDAGDFTGGIITNGLITILGDIVIFSGTEMDVEVDADCAGIQLSGSEFNEICYFESRGVSSSSGQGGNIFNSPVTIDHNGTSEHFYMGITNGDVFNDSLTIINASTQYVYPSSDDSTTYKEVIILSSTSSGTIQFSRSGGVSALIDDAYIQVDNGDFSSGTLILGAIEQTISNVNDLHLTGSATLNIIDCEFDGEFNAISPDILFKENVFNEIVDLEKTGGTHNQCVGDNTFNDVTTITNSSTKGLRLAVISADLFASDVIFVGSNGSLTSGYGVISEYEGDVTANGDAVFLKYAEMVGTNNQSLEGTSDHSYRELTLNKPSGNITANTPVIIAKFVKFTEGILATDTVNIITFKAGSTADNANDTSFIAGPVKKIGDTAFDFPIGKTNIYRPLGITEPLVNTDAFTAEFFAEDQIFGTNMDTTISFISDCSYWNINRTNGTSDIVPKFAFDSLNCDYLKVRPVHIANWNGKQMGRFRCWRDG